jgi:hypothetical protein
VDSASLIAILAMLVTGGVVLVGGVALTKTLAQRHHDAHRGLFYVTFPSEMTPASALAALGSATGLDRPHQVELGGVPSTAIETLVVAGAVRYRLAVPEDAAQYIRHQLEMHVPGARVDEGEEVSEPWHAALEVRLSPTTVLLEEMVEDAARTVYAALQRAQGPRAVLLQWIVTPTRGGASFHATGRIAARAERVDERGRRLADPTEARALLREVRWALTAVWASNSDVPKPRAMPAAAHPYRPPLINPVVVAVAKQLLGMTGRPDFWRRSRHRSERAARRAIRKRLTPIIPHFTLTKAELAAVTALPLGKSPLPGIAAASARPLPADASIPTTGVAVAEALYGPPGRLIAISRRARLDHMMIVGPTDSGKSYAMGTIALGDMAAGDGVGVMGPPDLIEELLPRIPRHRADDVIVVEPAKPEFATGFNILRGADPEDVGDHVVAIFRELHRNSWGPRTDYWLYVAVKTLAGIPGMTLCEVPLLLSNERFRAGCVEHINDSALKHVWADYEDMTPGERREVLSPISNKVQPLLLRRAIRPMLGQAAEGIDLDHIVNSGKILLVALPQGDKYRLLGSLLIGRFTQTVFERAALPPGQRRPFYMHIDEAPDVVNLPSSLSLAVMLAQSRKYGCGLDLAFQYLEQLGDRQSDLMHNARNKMVFSTSFDEARTLSKEFDVADPTLIQRLGRHEVMLRVVTDAGVSPPATGKTLTMPEPSVGLADYIRRHSRELTHSLPRDEALHLIELRQSVFRRGLPSRRQGPPVG